MYHNKLFLKIHDQLHQNHGTRRAHSLCRYAHRCRSYAAGDAKKQAKTSHWHIAKVYGGYRWTSALRRSRAPQHRRHSLNPRCSRAAIIAVILTGAAHKGPSLHEAAHIREYTGDHIGCR
jgi:hypothetical protein